MSTVPRMDLVVFVVQGISYEVTESDRGLLDVSLLCRKDQEDRAELLGLLEFPNDGKYVNTLDFEDLAYFIPRTLEMNAAVPIFYDIDGPLVLAVTHETFQRVMESDLEISMMIPVEAQVKVHNFQLAYLMMNLQKTLETFLQMNERITELERRVRALDNRTIGSVMVGK